MKIFIASTLTEEHSSNVKSNFAYVSYILPVYFKNIQKKSVEIDIMQQSTSGTFSQIHLRLPSKLTEHCSSKFQRPSFKSNQNNAWK